jgi:PncC family amidohydrolase
MMNVEEQVGTLLASQSLTLVTAESCTGGLVAHRVTNVSGSSAYYLGGFVTYANAAKEEWLGVQHETLLAHGAVSEETAREMARGARQRTGADVGIAVTGIAGPTGGTPDKPVGLVYIALSAKDAEHCRRYVWKGNRLFN